MCGQNITTPLDSTNTWASTVRSFYYFDLLWLFNFTYLYSCYPPLPPSAASSCLLTVPKASTVVGRELSPIVGTSNWCPAARLRSLKQPHCLCTLASHWCPAARLRSLRSLVGHQPLRGCDECICIDVPSRQVRLHSVLHAPIYQALAELKHRAREEPVVDPLALLIFVDSSACMPSLKALRQACLSIVLREHCDPTFQNRVVDVVIQRRQRASPSMSSRATAFAFPWPPCLCRNCRTLLGLSCLLLTCDEV